MEFIIPDLRRAAVLRNEGDLEADPVELRVPLAERILLRGGLSGAGGD
jgi:hypothetical protein